MQKRGAYLRDTTVHVLLRTRSKLVGNVLPNLSPAQYQLAMVYYTALMRPNKAETAEIVCIIMRKSPYLCMYVCMYVCMYRLYHKVEVST